MDPAAVLAARKSVKPAADAAVARLQFPFVETLQLAHGANAVARQFLSHRLADAPDDPDRLPGKKGPGFRPADHGEAVRLVEVGRDLGQKLVVAQPDRRRDAGFAADAADQPGQDDSRRRAVQTRRAGQVEKGFVDGDRLDRGREVFHHPADLPADRLVFRHVRPDYHGVGAGF